MSQTDSCEIMCYCKQLHDTGWISIPGTWLSMKDFILSLLFIDLLSQLAFIKIQMLFSSVMLYLFIFLSKQRLLWWQKNNLHISVY